MFPRKELKIGGNSYAIFILESGGIDIIKISARKGRSFYCKYGYFEPNEEYRYICGKSDVYFFDQNSANPLKIGALVDIQTFLIKSFRPQLMADEINYLLGRSEIEQDFQEKEKQDQMNAHIKSVAHALGPMAVKYLYEYFDEDIVARHDIKYEASHKERFRIRKSYGIVPFIPQDTIGKRNVAIVVINDTMLDIMIVEPEVDPIKKIRYFEAGRYGKFYIRENRTRYRFKKTNVYIVGVTTDGEEGSEPTKAPEQVQPTTLAVKKPQEIDGEKKKKKQSATDEKLDKIATLLEELARRELEQKNEQPQKKESEKRKGLFRKKEKQEASKKEKKLLKRKKNHKPNDLELYRYTPVTMPVYVGDEQVENGDSVETVPKFVQEPQTIAINAAKFLPHVNYNDPVLVKNAFENIKHQKIAIDLTSRPAVKPTIDPKVIMAIGIVVMMFLIIGLPVLIQFDIINVGGGGGGGGFNIFEGLFGGGGSPPPPPSEPVTPGPSENIDDNRQDTPLGLPIPKLPQIGQP